MSQIARSPLLGPVSGRRTAEAIVRRLTEGITTGELLPGERLPTEEALAKTFEVAPMTLRQALAALRDLQLIETRRGRNGGSYVRSDVVERLAAAAQAHTMDVAQLRDFTDWRRAISGEACALAAGRGPSARHSELVAIDQQFRDNARSVPRRRMDDSRFHLLIAELSGSTRLLEAERELQEQFTNLVLSLPDIVAVRESVATGHTRLIRAILERRPDDARREMHEHAESSYDWTVALLADPHDHTE